MRTCIAGTKNADGFALLLTLTLLSFLVLLLVGLATYTRVETAIAGNMQRQGQARENALLALNVALGQLQRHAGPDQRVTATAESFPDVNAQKTRYTGVWSSAPAPDTDPRQPLGWLVSGAETGVLDDLTATIPAIQQVVLLSTGSAASGNVTATLQPIQAPGVPGQPASPAGATIGRYAWWVGDQGVKAPVAPEQSSEAVDYAPYDLAELRTRIRQQMSFGAGAADAGGEPIFESQDANNTPLVSKLAAPNHLAFVRSASNTPLGLATWRQNFHAWSPNNFAVLADPERGGLRQDLSLVPSRLGESFAAWANYPAYTEVFTPTPAPAEPTEPAETTEEPVEPTAAGPTAPAILPAYGADPIRRRYILTPHTTENQSRGSHQVVPVLTYFLLSFNVRTEPNPSGPSDDIKPLEIRARWMVSLWNPYTGALVPENMRIEISRFTGSIQLHSDGTDPSVAVGGPVSFQSAFGQTIRLQLPWDSTSAPENTSLEDRQSWLPGRVYSWRSVENTAKGSSIPSGGFASEFYSQTLSDGGQGVIRNFGGATIDGEFPSHLEVNGPQTFTIRLYAVRSVGDALIGTFTSPEFSESFNTTQQRAQQGDYQFSYVFRLAESFVDNPTAPGTWLLTTGRDLRHRTLSSDSFVVGENGNNPASYNESYSKILSPSRLLSRRSDSKSYNEDVTVYEYPRAPLLSMGALQHFRLLSHRPFMIGNPWGTNVELNNMRLGSLFDRFFFSGLVDGIVPDTNATGDLVSPNPLLKPLRKSDGTKPTIADIRATVTIPEIPATDTTEAVPATPSAAEGRSSKYFLQGGAFNLNSKSAAAWRAVLRGVRYTEGSEFSYLDASADSGTAGDDSKATVSSNGEARFFRFSHSAQETYKAESGQSAPDAENGETPPNTHLFRQGMRTLSGGQVAALADRIVELVALKHAATDGAGGPFRSVDDFLSRSFLFAGVDVEGNAGSPRSLLEAAIGDTGINSTIAEFSSQWLTQADVMTVLAPVLFARSDTFLIRTYGEAVNPATGATDGRAWCEALVQRLPEYFADPTNTPPETLPATFGLPSDPEDPTSAPTASNQLNQLYGRRFKVVSFRWLTRSDL